LLFNTFIGIVYLMILLYLLFNNIKIDKIELSEYSSSYCHNILKENYTLKDHQLSIPEITLQELREEYELYSQSTNLLEEREIVFRKKLDLYSCYNKEFKKDKFILLYIDGMAIDQFNVVMRKLRSNSLIFKEKPISFKQSGSLGEYIFSGKFSQNYAAKASFRDNLIQQLIYYNKFIKKNNPAERSDHSYRNLNENKSHRSHSYNKERLRNTDEINKSENTEEFLTFSSILSQGEGNEKNSTNISKTISNNAPQKTISLTSKSLGFEGIVFPLYNLFLKHRAKRFDYVKIHKKSEKGIFQGICNYHKDFLPKGKEFVNVKEMKEKYPNNNFENKDEIKEILENTYLENHFSQDYFSKNCVKNFLDYDRSIYVTSSLDVMNHHYSKFKIEDIIEATKAQIFILEAAKWVDSHPEYALIVLSDHGGQSYPTEDNFCNHGCMEDNEGIFFAYYGNGKKEENNENTNKENNEKEHSKAHHDGGRSKRNNKNNRKSRNLDFSSIAKQTFRYLEPSNKELIDKTEIIEYKDISQVFSYLINGMNNPIESRGLFPLDSLKNDFLKVSILRHKELQLKQFSEKLSAKLQSHGMSRIVYPEFNFNQQPINEELVQAYKMHVINQQNYLTEEASNNTSMTMRLSFFISILVLIIYSVFIILGIYKKIKTNNISFSSRAAQETKQTSSLLSKFTNYLIYFNFIYFIFEILLYTIFREYDFNHTFYNFNYVKLILELVTIVAIMTSHRAIAKKDLAEVTRVEYKYSDSREKVVFTNPFISCSQSNSSGLEEKHSNLTTDNNNPPKKESDSHMDLAIFKEKNDLLKILLKLLIIKLVVSVIFVHYQLLAKFKKEIPFYGLKKPLIVLGSILYTALNIYLISYKYQHGAKYLRIKDNRPQIRYDYVFYFFQAMIISTMFIYDLFLDHSYVEESEIKAFAAKIIYSLDGILYMFILFNKQKYNSNLQPLRPDFKDLKFVILNFFFFLNDQAERLVMLLIVIPIYLTFNHLIEWTRKKIMLIKSENIQENDSESVSVLTDNDANITQTSFNKDDLHVDNKIGTELGYDNQIQKEQNSQKGTNGSQSKEIGEAQELFSGEKGRISQNMNKIKNFLIDSPKTEVPLINGRNSFLYQHIVSYEFFLLLLIMVINFTENITCIVAKLFSFDIYLSVGSRTIGLKPEYAPLFTGFLFVFHKLQNYIILPFFLLDNVKLQKPFFSSITSKSRTVLNLVALKMISSLILAQFVLWMGGNELNTTYYIYFTNFMFAYIFGALPIVIFTVKEKISKYFQETK